jgi:hypothetical protein
MSEPKSFRRVNRALGQQPKIGPFPAGQILPFCLILFLSYMAKQALHLSWINAALFSAWMMGTFWIVTGARAWRFFSKFISPPFFARAFVRYSFLLDESVNRK